MQARMHLLSELVDMYVFCSFFSDACWAFSYITDGTNEKIQWVIETGVVPRFVQLLHISEGENAALITPCLRWEWILRIKVIEVTRTERLKKPASFSITNLSNN